MHILLKAGLGIVAVVGSLVVIGIAVSALLFHFWFYNDTAEVTSYDDTVEGISSIEMDIDAGKIILREGSEFHVDAENMPEGSFTSSVENGTWCIKVDAEGSSHFQIFGINIPFRHTTVYKDMKITVTIPEDFHAEDMTLELGAGSFEAKRLTSDNLVVDIGAGSMDVDTVNITDYANFTVGAGELAINDLTAEDTKFDCGVGSIRVNGIITGDNNIHCGIGEIDMNLDGAESDYNYSIDCGLGEVKIGNKTNVTNTSMNIDNDQDNSFSIDCGIGSIELSFN